MNLNDNRLIIKTLKSGDQKVFSLVYASYYKPLCLFCSSYVSLEEAEEIVQDLMMYVWEKRELLVEDLSLKSFLFTSVRNRALNSITRSHITRQVYEEYQSQQLKSLPALDSCYGTELFNTYMEALHSLPKELQRVYVMSRYKQLTHKEIADKLEVSVQTVNYRIGKTLQFFRIRLKDFLPRIVASITRGKYSYSNWCTRIANVSGVSVGNTGQVAWKMVFPSSYCSFI